MEIIVKWKKNYGKDLFYPVSKDAQFICKLTGRPTILKNQLKLMSENKWDVQIEYEPIYLHEIFEEAYDGYRSSKIGS